MYDMIHDAWLNEKRNAELQKLPQDFYAKLAEYIGQIRQEGRMLDHNSAKAKLISQELSNAKRLTEQLAKLRFKKIVDNAIAAKPFARETLTLEEEKAFLGLRPLVEDYQTFLKNLLRGKTAKVEEKAEPSKRKLLRFLQEVPAIVGADLKVYGPFSAEDVATLPIENAKVLVKREAAMEIETK